MKVPRLFGVRLRVFAAVFALLLLQACSATAPSGNPDSPIRIAGVFSGAVTDADYNALGWVALDEAAKKYDAHTSFSENVEVPDVERVMREYVADGYTIVWSHGSQYYQQTLKLALEFPEVSFIGEFDAEPEDLPDNLWVIDRNFHNAFYPIGVLAGALTKQGKIGYVGGLSLPFSYSEVHAVQQALTDTGSSAQLTSVWTGNFNDPTKAQQITRQMSDQGNDVIIGSMNMGMVGVFQAAKQDDREQWIVGKYTDKSQFSPEDAGASVVYDFVGPLDDIVGDILAGQRTGYLPLGFDTGVEIVMPDRVPAEVRAKVDQAVADIISGKIVVVKDTTPVK
ncbi:BMP family protein [Propionibacteriaceae bacterium Y1923]|uniref:BMP family protein n=1 Tax=Aestuariimicrobium sp. Y1814 TaxID=3418742 RepID=UPI003C24BA88